MLPLVFQQHTLLLAVVAVVAYATLAKLKSSRPGGICPRRRKVTISKMILIIMFIIYIINNVLMITREYGVDMPPKMQFYSDTSHYETDGRDAPAPHNDGLMVLAFFYEKILFGREMVNISMDGYDQYKNEGNILLDGNNMSMFDAVRALRHNVNPNFDVRDGMWSNMEWDNLLHYNILQNMTPSTLPAIQTPLEFSKGGLGWYDNLDFNVRQRQGSLAKQHGVDGFIFYTTAKQNSPAMTRAVVDARVRDGEPSGSFAVMVVDDCRYACTREEILGTKNLIAFGKWLANITSHSDYIRVNGKPVIYIYKLGSFLADGDTVATPESIRRAFSLVEKTSGIALHWIGTDTFHCLRGISNQAKESLYGELDAWIDFAPHRGKCMTAEPVSVPPQINVFYETFLAGWYPAPRGLTWFASKHSAGWSGKSYRAQSPCHPRNSPARFYEVMKQGFVQTRCRNESSNTVLLKDGQVWKPLTIFAWNEWGEQAVLEPSALNGFSYLQSLHQARLDAAFENCSLWQQGEHVTDLVEIEISEDDSDDNFCGSNNWSGTQIRCEERVKFLVRKYQMSEHNAKISILGNGCQCR